MIIKQTFHFLYVSVFCFKSQIVQRKNNIYIYTHIYTHICINLSWYCSVQWILIMNTYLCMVLIMLAKAKKKISTRAWPGLREKLKFLSENGPSWNEIQNFGLGLARSIFFFQISTQMARCCCCCCRMPLGRPSPV